MNALFALIEYLGGRGALIGSFAASGIFTWMLLMIIDRLLFKNKQPQK